MAEPFSGNCQLRVLWLVGLAFFDTYRPYHVFSYISGRLIVQYEGRRKIQKAVSGTNIILNLSILGVFKYYNFFAENFAVLFRNIGWQVDWVTLDILLPVGISFYTFQALSYSIDVYQKKLPVCKDIISFFAYISFFPQLVAGPIERATNLLPQFYKSRTFDYAQALDGCRQMLWGFFKKIVVAYNCAEAANVIWGDYSNQSGFTLCWVDYFLHFRFMVTSPVIRILLLVRRVCLASI